MGNAPEMMLDTAQAAGPAPAGAAGRASPAPAAPRSTFWVAFWLAAVLIGAKSVHLGVPEPSWSMIREYVRDLVVVSHSDIVFACVIGALAQCALLRTRQAPRATRAVWYTLIAFCLVFTVYAIISVQVFAYLQSPLTYPLIYLAGDVKNMQSSVNDFVSPGLLGSLVGVPLAYLLLVWCTDRYIQPARTRTFRVYQACCVAGLLVYVAIGRTTYGGPWSDRNDRRIAENPHWTLLVSLKELFGGTFVRMEFAFPAEDLLDFETTEARGGDATWPPLPFDRPRNVILLVLESTSARYLDIYGGPFQNVTPRLAAEADNSLILDNFYCHVGLTANAVVAISIGIYPGMTWEEYTKEYPTLPGTTVADVARPHGYRTAFIHNGDLEYTNQRGFLSNRGWDALWDYRDLACGEPDFNNFSWGVEDRCLIDGMLKWIDQDRTKPFFLLGWTIQAHHPYTLLPEERVDFFQGSDPPGYDDYHLDLYLNVLRETDRQVGRLLDGLRERGLADDTVVVITGDHGEAFGDIHDTYGHGGKVFEENVRVPMVLWNPRLFRGAGRSATVGAQVDLNPTIAHLLGVPPAGSWQGRSLFDPGRPPRAYFYAARDDYLFALRDGDWKYIYNATTGRHQLYNLATDPTEQHNVASQEPQRCDRMRQRLAAWLHFEEHHLQKLHGDPLR